MKSKIWIAVSDIVASSKQLGLINRINLLRRGTKDEKEEVQKEEVINYIYAIALANDFRHASPRFAIHT